MDTKENLHGGHRERMMQKFKQSADAMPEHEILEMILFYAIPRVDTNPIAHRLLRVFGSLSKVFSASAEELTAVDGVGERTACFLSLFGQVAKRAFSAPDALSEIKRFSFNKNKADLIEFFKGLTEEKFIILMLDKKYNFLSHTEFNDQHRDKVTAEIPEIALAFALHKPTFAIIAHNHPSGNFMPSKEDDLATAKINAICALHRVTLIDHIICSDRDAYSYHYAGALEEIKTNYDINKFFRNI